MVNIAIEFTEEERAIIKARKLGRHRFAEYVQHGVVMPLNVRDFLNQQMKFRFSDFTDAQNFEAHMQERLLYLKHLLQVGASAEPGRAYTFEL